MPAPIAPLVGFSLGAVFAWVAGHDSSRRPGSSVVARCLLLVTLFSALVFAPITAYFAAFAPDWSYAYFVDTERLPDVVNPCIVLLAVASVPCGFAACIRRAHPGRIGLLLRVAAAPAALALAVVIATFPRLSLSATYAQFHGDFGVRSVAGSPLGYALLWMTAVLLAGTLLTLRALRRIGATSPRNGGRRRESN